MHKKIALIAFYLLAICSTGIAQEIDSAAALIHSPQELVSWLSQNFKYEMKIPDKRQSAGETAALASGDCEDFAVLSHELLKRIGIDSQIVVIKFQGLNLCHAVCLFKEGLYYSFISNKELFRTRSDSVKAVFDAWFPDWASIYFATPEMEYTRIIDRS